MTGVRFDVRRGRGFKPFLAVGIALLTTAGSGVRAGASDSGGPDLATYQVLARADAFTVEVVYASTPVIPGGEIAKASPATSQTVVNSTGQSLGFASAPYPGDFIISGPGSANGVLAGTAPPVPYYPFVAYSSFPGEPKAEASQGPYKLSTVSEEHKSAAVAEMGAVMGGQPSIASARATSTSLVDMVKRELTAEADSAMDGLIIGPLAIGHVAGHAKMVGAPGQTPSKESAFSVGTMSIAGTTVGFTDKGLQMASGSAPVPDLSALGKVLSEAGITLTYLPASQTETGIDSAGLAIGFSGNVPQQGPGRITLTLGRVRAEVSSTTTEQFEAVTGPTDDQSTATGPSSATEPTMTGRLVDGPSIGPGTSEPLNRAGVSFEGNAGASSAFGTGASPVDPGQTAGELALAATAPAPTQATLATVGGGPLRHDGDSRVYLVFMVAAGTLVLVSGLFSRRAIRVTTRWTD